MKIGSLQNLLLILCIALMCVSSAAAVIHVFGYEGRDVKVSCPYERGYESHVKYLCKNNCGNDDVLIRTSQRNKNKYSIYDDTRSRIFTATISDLRSVDAGTYWCGVSRFLKDSYTEVKLEISQDSCCDSVTKIQSHEEGSVSISCPYESQYQNNLKYMCRGKRPSTCLQQAVITSDNTHNAQFALTDDKESRKFTVTVSSLTLNDSGSYLCGVHRNNGLDVFSAVELEVKESVSLAVTRNKTITVKTTNSTHLSTNSNKGTTLFVGLSVLAVLLVMISALVIAFKHKRSKTQGAGVVTNGNTSEEEDAEGVTGGADIYANKEVVMFSKQRTSNQQSSCHLNDDAGDDQPDYENFTAAEDIYCNQNYHKVNKK